MTEKLFSKTIRRLIKMTIIEKDMHVTLTLILANSNAACEILILISPTTFEKFMMEFCLFNSS